MVSRLPRRGARAGAREWRESCTRSVTVTIHVATTTQRLAGRRRSVRDQRVEQPPAGRRDLVHRPLERLGVGP